MIYLTVPELLHVAERALGVEPKIRDIGLLEAAAARPAATAFGCDAYPDLDAKAAALLHSLARNHALVDGNKRLALAGIIAFHGLNGRRRLRYFRAVLLHLALPASIPEARWLSACVVRLSVTGPAGR